MAARSQFQYRASEPSQLETGLALGALKPEQSGMAMAMLPGAASMRQDLGAAAGRAAERDALLAEMTLQQKATSDDDKAMLEAYKLTVPGAQSSFMENPRFARLLAGVPQSTVDRTNLLTQGQFREQQATTQDKLADSYYKGIQSGYTIPPDTASEQMGFPLSMRAPEQEILQGMRARASAAAAAKEQNPAAHIEYVAPTTPGGVGSVKYSFPSVPAQFAPQFAAETVRLNETAQPSVYRGPGQQTTVEQTAAPPSMGYTKDKGGHITPTGTGLKPAPQKPAASSGTQTSSAAPAAPQGGALFPSVRTTPWSQAPTGLAKQAADEMFNKAPTLGLTRQQMQQIKQAHATGNFEIARGEDGRRYLVMGGVPVAPLNR